MVRLGLLFLVIDRLHHEDVWKQWMDSRVTRAWVHAKDQKKVSPWIRRRLVPTPWSPEWGSIDLVHAMVALLRAALGAPSVTHVLFLSETCVPLYAARDTARRLAAGQSWMDVRARPNNGYAALRQFAKAQCAARVLKADQWVLLSRAHARAVVDVYDTMPDLRLFRHVKAADEIFVPTALQLRPGAAEPGLKRQKAVYVDWSLSCKHPRAFQHNECVPAMARARALGCLFLRKVEAPVTHAAWTAWIENIQTSDIKESSSLRARAEAPASKVCQALQRQYPHDHITPYFERIWSEEECWRYVHAPPLPPPDRY